MKKFSMKKSTLLQIISIFLVVAAIVTIVIVRYTGDAGKGTAVPEHTDSDKPAAMKKAEAPKVIEEVRTIDVSVVRDGLKDMGILITEEYYFTDVITYSESLQLFSTLKIPFTETSYVATYDGEVTAGINFEDVRVIWDKNSSTMTVTVPAATIQNVIVDHESFELINSKNGIGTKIDPAEFNETLVELEHKARQDAIDKGTLKRADENALRLVENLVRTIMSTQEDPEYDLVVRTA